MNEFDQEPSGQFIVLDTGCVRVSRIESVVFDEKRWGITTTGNDLWVVTVTPIGGATFSHKTTDKLYFLSLCTGVNP